MGILQDYREHREHRKHRREISDKLEEFQIAFHTLRATHEEVVDILGLLRAAERAKEYEELWDLSKAQITLASIDEGILQNRSYVILASQECSPDAQRKSLDEQLNRYKRELEALANPNLEGPYSTAFYSTSFLRQIDFDPARSNGPLPSYDGHPESYFSQLAAEVTTRVHAEAPFPGHRGDESKDSPKLQRVLKSLRYTSALKEEIIISSRHEIVTEIERETEKVVERIKVLEEKYTEKEGLKNFDTALDKLRDAQGQITLLGESLQGHWNRYEDDEDHRETMRKIEVQAAAREEVNESM